MPWVAAAAAVVGSAMSADSTRSAANSAADASTAASKYSADIQKKEYDQTRQDQMPWLQTGSSALNRLAYLNGVGPGGMQTKDQLRASLISKFTHGPAQVPFNPINQTSYNGATGAGGYGSPASAAPPVVYSPPVGPNNVDDKGLNAAVDSAFAAQKADPAYGSLQRNFTQSDLNADPVYQNGLQFGLSEGEKGINNQAAANGSMLSGATLKALTRYGNDFGTTKAQGAYDRFNANQTNQSNRLSALANVGQTAANTLGSAGSSYANNVGTLAMGNAANQGNALLVGANARGSSYQGMSNALGKVDWSNLFSSNGSNSDQYRNDEMSRLNAQAAGGG